MSKTLDNTAGLPMWTRARTTDPDTSHQAAASMEDGAASQRKQINQYLIANAGRTADALDHELGLRVTSAGRRLSELEAAGLVRKTERRAPTRSGRSAIIWEAIDECHHSTVKPNNRRPDERR